MRESTAPGLRMKTRRAVTEALADTALDLDAVVEKLLKGGDIEDLVARGLRSVDDVLQESMLATCPSGR